MCLLCPPNSPHVSPVISSVKKVNYIAIDIDGSEHEDVYTEPITITDSSEEEDRELAPASKRKRVISRSTKAARRGPKKVKSASTDALEAPGPVEKSHATSRHDPTRLLPYVPALLDWFENQRDVRGWCRGARLCFQQTQVATVIPYYNRWLEKFPTLETLAAAELADVHALWKGLGYYRRAGFLLAAAKKVKETYGGHIPEDARVMQKEVPGMGRYTAGAVASIAYGIKAPVLDGNVQRLLSRALALYANPKSKQALDILWGAATVLVEGPVNTDTDSIGALPGNINQALIELGSTVCKPTNPSCGECPLSAGCAANEISKLTTTTTKPPVADIEEICGICSPLPTTSFSVVRFPMKIEKKKARVETSVVCTMKWTSAGGDQWWLMTKRPETGLLAGLWEFPTIDLPSTSQASPDASDDDGMIASALLTSMPSVVLPKLLASSSSGARVQSPKYIGSIPHIFSHIHKTYEVVYSIVEWHGDNPPELGALHNASKAKESVKSKRKRADTSTEYALPVESRWIPNEAVIQQK
ncbi:A G-specific adenine DNA glycosylase [Rhizoctonia solani]|uniref:Adenine DNA glycosylase n=1 Tax=Rhizoctonia solani TaxID=456999 RepID=A0A8H7I859_9AGAM|nr:A G-specific adenine DNA glycosylase [Rhizoctonia solani]